MDFVAIDFETANEKRSSPCAIGIAEVSAGRLTGARSWLIRPPQGYFDRFNVSIHGITEADVAGAPEFDELWPILLPYLDGKTVIAHNAGFDISVLKHTLDHYGIEPPRLRYACTVVISKLAWPDRSTYRLNAMADHLGITFRHHDAGEDAEACAKIALKACRQTDSPGLHDLLKRFNISRGILAGGFHRPVRRKSGASR